MRTMLSVEPAWGERGKAGAVLWAPFSREGEQQGLPADMEEL